MFSNKCCILAFITLVTTHVCATDTFILTNAPAKKKHSTAKLKELIGQETKLLFNQTTQLGTTLAQVHEHVAHLQKSSLKTKDSITGVLEQTATMHELCSKINNELAFVQNHCSSLIESLIDDAPPFKKAAKNDLNEAFLSLGDIRKTMETTINSCQSWCNQAKQDKAPGIVARKKMGMLCKNLDSCASALSSVKTTMNGHQCLKLT